MNTEEGSLVVSEYPQSTDWCPDTDRRVSPGTKSPDSIVAERLILFCVRLRVPFSQVGIYFSGI